MKFLTNSGNFEHFPNFSGTFSQNLETVCHFLNINACVVFDFRFGMFSGLSSTQCARKKKRKNKFYKFIKKEFYRILPEFQRNGKEMTNCLEILRRSARKIRKMLEISGICEKFHFSFHFFIRLPSLF